MALNKKISPYFQKYLEGDYDNALRVFSLFTATPALVLVAVDINRYEKNSTLKHAHHLGSVVLDGIALAILSLAIIWSLFYHTTRQYMLIRPLIVTLMDLLLLAAMTGLGDTILAMRSSPSNCSEVLGECSNSALNIMRAAGALTVITSVPLHLVCSAAFRRRLARRRQMKKNNRDNNAAEEDGAISFENEIK